MPQKIRNKIIFQATNKHDKKKGIPPRIDTTNENQYYAYFENSFREQFIFVFDYPSHVGTLWLSRKGWEHPFEVADGKAQGAGLTNPEKAWLRACWSEVSLAESRRDHIQKWIEEQKHPESVSPEKVFPREETAMHMDNLYDGLMLIGLEPACTREEFVRGWTDLAELIASLEAKYEDQLRS